MCLALSLSLSCIFLSFWPESSSTVPTVVYLSLKVLHTVYIDNYLISLYIFSLFRKSYFCSSKWRCLSRAHRLEYRRTTWNLQNLLVQKSVHPDALFAFVCLYKYVFLLYMTFLFLTWSTANFCSNLNSKREDIALCWGYYRFIGLHKCSQGRHFVPPKATQLPSRSVL